MVYQDYILRINYKNPKKKYYFRKILRLGGRIRTEKLGETIIEMGAARFSNKHKLLIKLLKKLNLEDKKIELPKNIDFYFKNKKIKYMIFTKK